MTLWDKINQRVRRLGAKPPSEKNVCMQVPKAELAKYLPEFPIVVEAGGHTGKDTVEFAQQWPKGKIYTFEPVPDIFHQLRTNTAAYPNVTCFPKALSAMNGRQELFVSAGASDGSSSLLKPAEHRAFHPDVTFASKIVVETTTLDSWAEESGIGHVDLLWLDLQGNEPDVLRASPNVLRSVQAIHTEVSLVNCYEGGMLYPAFRAWMATQGFQVKRELLPFPDMGNVLFVNSK